MRSSSIPYSKDLVLIGGGHCHALVLLKWAMNPLPGVRLTLINPDPNAPYTGMLPGYVSGHYTFDEINIDLVRIAQHANARYVLDQVKNIDLNRHRIHRTNGPDIYYDLLSINVGISLAIEELEGFNEFGTPAKPLGVFARQWDRFVQKISIERFQPNIVVIGAGVGGVELAMAMKYQLSKMSSEKANVTLIESQESILGEINVSARNKLTMQLNHYQIKRLCNSQVQKITSTGVILKSGKLIPANFVVGTAGARAFSWIHQTKMPNRDGFIIVDKYLRSTYPDNSIFAVGDCAFNPEFNLPRAGVFAVRQAPVLYSNLKASLTGKPLKPFIPQSDFLKIISTGHKNAVSIKFSIAFEGANVWRWKNAIDKKFMNKFDLDLTPPKHIIPDDIPLNSQSLINTSHKLCTGCGAKVGSSSLNQALDEALSNSKFEWQGDAAEIQLNDRNIVVSTDHLRPFTLDHALFAKICALHSMSDVWAKGAQPKYALASITIPFMADRLQAETLREIMQVAHNTFSNAGVAIVGGHTAQGPELSIGFTVVSDPKNNFLSHSGAQSGDKIILTKPIGTGVILAGNMQGKVSGDHLYKCLEVMAQSSQKAAQLLAPIATTMTDITGFGLAGHLFNLLKGSKKCASLHLVDIPLLDGALQLSNEGIQSTLWESNSKVSRYFSELDDPRCKLLFDPQTSGGLCATIPNESQNKIIDQLKSSGITAHVIGTVYDGDPFVDVF